jgi:hypothetical protein
MRGQDPDFSTGSFMEAAIAARMPNAPWLPT